MAKAKSEFARFRKNLSKLPGTAWRQLVTGYKVPHEPKFHSAEATAWFAERLSAARSYLEWGSGGSTVTAARLGIPFVTVESDRFFLDAVRREISRLGYVHPGQDFRFASLGITSAWGRPLLPNPVTAGLRAKFRSYSDIGGSFAKSESAPDLALVDGRFRVACALKFMLRFGQQHNWVLAVDDFGTREDYGAITEFATFDRLIGRLAVFMPGKPYDEAALRNAIAQYELIDD